MSSIVSRNAEIGLHQIRPDLSGTVIEGDHMTLVRWSVAAGHPATGVHSHQQHEQFTIVIEGSVETMVGEETLILSAGDVCRIRAGVLHGKTRPLGETGAVLIDVFEPRREDYLVAARSAQ